MKSATAVQVVVIGENIKTDSLEQHFDDCGIDMTISRIGAMPAVDEGACITDWALTENIDLIIQGAYGRRRRFELLFGGMTESMLGSSPVPVLMVGR